MSLDPTPYRQWARMTADARFARWFRHAPIGTPLYRAPAGQGNFSFNASTTDSTGAPIANCDVYLFLANVNTPVARTVSDANGRFTFDNPGSGPFFLVAFSGNNPVGTTSNGAYPDPKPVNPYSFSTTFPATENPISQGGIWVHGGTNGLDWHNIKTTGGRAVGTTVMGASVPARYSDNLAHIKTSYRTYAANQFAQATAGIDAGYTGNGSKHEMELLLRFSISANDAHGYEVMWGANGGDPYFAVVKWNGALGDFTTLYDPGSNIASPTPGDVFRAEMSGTNIRVYLNGSLLITVDATQDFLGNTISTWGNGQPGLGSWPADTALPDSFGWSSWAAGDL